MTNIRIQNLSIYTSPLYVPLMSSKIIITSFLKGLFYVVLWPCFMFIDVPLKIVKIGAFKNLSNVSDSAFCGKSHSESISADVFLRKVLS